MSGSVRFGAFEFDPNRRELRKHGLKIRVPGQSLEILGALIEHPGEFVTRERIRTLLWPHGTVVEFEQSISAAVKRLREAISDPAANPRFIERVPRRGYRFIAPVRPLALEPKSAADIRTGTALLHYRLVEKAGQGSMGEVWKAEDTILGRTVALKFIPERLAEDADALEAFRAEARHAAALNDANICTLYGLEDWDGRWFLVMEYIAGYPLNTALAGDPLPVERILDIGLQAAGALAAAHKAGIIHCDLKPANFMLSADGRLKLTDFGIAKVVQGGPAASNHNGRHSPTGTLEYMSPEQARGDPVDPRSDLFSLGVVLYEMATGRPPFRGDTPAAILDAVLLQTPARPRALNRRLPRELDRVIVKALEKEPEARWQSATDMADAFRRIGSARAKRRSRLRLAVGAAAAVAAAVLAGWLWMSSGPVLAERDAVVIADFENTTGDNVFDGALRQALLSQIGQSPRFSIASEERVRRALALSGRAPAERFTRGVARDICQRLGGKAVLAGSVGRLGTRYLVGLSAVGCDEGDTLVTAYAEADSREQVLAALSSAVSRMRGRLGESLASIRKLSVPAEAATSSLEALKAYSLALAEKARGNDVRPLLQHSIQLDPDFASAWFTLAQVYFNRGEEAKAEEAMSRAYELRGRTSERERLLIEASYHVLVSGDLQKSIATGTLAAELYPRDGIARRAPFLAHCKAGELDKALQIAHREMELAPDDGVTYFNLAVLLLTSEKTAEARAVLDQARARGVSSELYPFARYVAAALDGDFGAMEREAESARGEPADVRLLALQVQTAAYRGQLVRAAEVARIVEQAAESNEVKAAVQATVALTEALFGRQQDGRNRAKAAVRLAFGRRAGVNAALALALADEPAAAEAVLRDLLRRYPHDTLLQTIWRPTIQGAVALSRGDPRWAVAEIQPSRGDAHQPWPQDIRGLACLKLGLAAEAAAEFRAVLGQKGPMFTGATWYGAAAAYPAAQVGLARALARDGQVEASRRVYGEFLAGWGRADPDVPLLVEAGREFAALAHK
jgi:DNA-binding winged helix-turn-helix (wHTH) protein/Flp pilus assembly protein TadD